MIKVIKPDLTQKKVTLGNLLIGDVFLLDGELGMLVARGAMLSVYLFELKKLTNVSLCYKVIPQIATLTYKGVGDA